MKDRELKINGRSDEADNPNSFQITFRTTRGMSAAWSSLRGLCKKFGHNELTPELFEKVVMPAMKRYVSEQGYLDKAKAEREAAKGKEAVA